MDEDAKLVPLVKLDGQEFLVDIDNRRFIDTNDLNKCINMHSQRGRDMINEMAGMEWRCFSVYPGKDGMEVCDTKDLCLTKGLFSITERGPSRVTEDLEV